MNKIDKVTIYEEIVQLAELMNLNWHDRQNRVIFTTKEKQSRRVYMFRINSRDEILRVYINNLVLRSVVSSIIISLSTNCIEHKNEQISTGFYTTCDFSFESFCLCISEITNNLLSS